MILTAKSKLHVMSRSLQSFSGLKTLTRASFGECRRIVVLEGLAAKTFAGLISAALALLGESEPALLQMCLRCEASGFSAPARDLTKPFVVNTQLSRYRGLLLPSPIPEGLRKWWQPLLLMLADGEDLLI